MHRLTKEQWKNIQPYVPKGSVTSRGGRPRYEDRAILQGILWVLRTGCPWRQIPAHYGSPATCWRRFQEWRKTGAFAYITKAFLEGIEDPMERLEWERYLVLEKSPHRSRMSKADMSAHLEEVMSEESRGDHELGDEDMGGASALSC
jgi:hypothetical protein